MAFFDLPLEELQKFKPERGEPADFDVFWQQTLSEASQFPLNPQFVPVDMGLKLLDVFDVTYAGYAGQAVSE